MSTAADSVITVLRDGHDALAARVATLTPQDLTARSAADEWTIAQTLSHLGSGAEIGLATLVAARDGGPAPDRDFNLGVWSRWDAMTPQEQADAFPTSNERLVAAFEALDETARRELRVTYGWLPAPVGVDVSARMRLSEFAMHRWDVEAGLDEGATVSPDAVPPLVDHALGGLLSWAAKTESLGGAEHLLAVRVSDPDRSFGLRLGGSVEVTETPAEPDGTLTLPAERLLRLAYGRLKEPYRTDGVAVTGPLSLDDLRRVFPGF
ncbi:maleylpyruvate isomerase family mycothiol-dependent enzyme [Catenuloplanes atrovinosus]|uniref:Uncharacterized protein (TIGR03083 family) n=1 Tax=Catenuloplanes atrovinosus TaxID=137266 RepID=A0AAE3YKM6_9ACTN|nr:maleylpyruvate isomerase family mycothiol-dependent enzyme [Catenuloplanes atrovinosus]MDR7274657.1 uncharacterized protein (TIGR03083 family) [Catenuloplanes atrovinosus]